mgnify:CR=1 FL=1
MRILYHHNLFNDDNIFASMPDYDNTTKVVDLFILFFGTAVLGGGLVVHMPR